MKLDNIIDLDWSVEVGALGVDPGHGCGGCNTPPRPSCDPGRPIVGGPDPIRGPDSAPIVTE